MDNPTEGAPAPQGPADDLIEYDHFAKLDLRVAQIESAEAVPKSKKLIRLQIDLGPQMGRRQIVAGVAQHYDPSSLPGRRIVVVANLKPAVLMGQESRGMLLAGESEGGAALRIVEPHADLPPGSKIR